MIYQLQKLVTNPFAGKEAYGTILGAGKEAYCTVLGVGGRGAFTRKLGRCRKISLLYHFMCGKRIFMDYWSFMLPSRMGEGCHCALGK